MLNMLFLRRSLFVDQVLFRPPAYILPSTGRFEAAASAESRKYQTLFQCPDFLVTLFKENLCSTTKSFGLDHVGAWER